MEDSVGEEERREQGETVVKARQEEGVEAGRGGGGSCEPGEEGGFLSAMASKIGAAMAGGDENSGEDGVMVNATAASGDEEERKENGHGGGGIFQKFMSSSHAPSTDSGASETEEVEGEESTQGAGGEQGGILSSMASRIGMAMSGANGNGNHHSDVDDAKTSNADPFDHMKGEEEKGDEANGGGILSTMASKIGMATSIANDNEDHSAVGDAKMSNGDAVDYVKGEEKRQGDDANGGILSAMASKIGMSMSGANGEGNHGGSGDDAKTSNGHTAGGSKVEEKGGEANAGGLIDQIMSNLPSDDQAPEADEASLLIAIIED